MKFYEFNEFGYYALIGANTEEEAVKYYQEVVADIEEDDGAPVEITEEEARAKLINACDEKELAIKEFNSDMESEYPYLVLMDKSLC